MFFFSHHNSCKWKDMEKESGNIYAEIRDWYRQKHWIRMLQSTYRTEYNTFSSHPVYRICTSQEKCEYIAIISSNDVFNFYY